MVIKERLACIVTIKTVMCIMHCRKYHLHTAYATETSICIITTKIVTYIFAAETVTCICAAKTYNWIIATETVTCIIATERSTSIPVTKYHLKTCINSTDVVTCIIAIKCHLHSFNRNFHLAELAIYRIFHLRKWCQSEILLVTTKKLDK